MRDHICIQLEMAVGQGTFHDCHLGGAIFALSLLQGYKNWKPDCLQCLSLKVLSLGLIKVCHGQLPRSFT